jgi:hypothetical protein
MVLEKRKKFHAYSGTNGSLFRLWPRLLHVVHDVILIVCDEGLTRQMSWMKDLGSGR